MRALLAFLAIIAVALASPRPETPPGWNPSTTGGPSSSGSYSANGLGNRADNAGAAPSQLTRLFPPNYADGAGSMSFSAMPSCCSLEPLFYTVDNVDLSSTDGLTLLAAAFGEFALVNDIVGAFDSADPADAQPQPCVPGYQRLESVPRVAPRQLWNNVTAFFDLSTVYGSDATTAQRIRALTGGLLLTGRGVLPPRGLSTVGVPISNPRRFIETEQLFAVGDPRGNENVVLLALHTLFLREHNRLASELAASQPSWDDERLYQKARALNIAQYQRVLADEFMPTVLGIYENLISGYAGFDARTLPAVSTEFAFAASTAFRAMAMNTAIEAVPGGIRKSRRFSDLTYNSGEVASRGIEPFLYGAMLQSAQDIQQVYAADLITEHHAVARDCLAGRDAGLPSFDTVRAAFGLTAAATSLPRKLDLLALYPSGCVDLWAGVLAEDRVIGAPFGLVLARLVAKQFAALRDGDPLWYANPAATALTAAERRSVQTTTLAHIIRRNAFAMSGMRVQDSVFTVPSFRPQTARRPQPAQTPAAAAAAAGPGRWSNQASKLAVAATFLAAATVLVTLVGNVCVFAVIRQGSGAALQRAAGKSGDAEMRLLDADARHTAAALVDAIDRSDSQ